jgi:hypothetical protein
MESIWGHQIPKKSLVSTSVIFLFFYLFFFISFIVLKVWKIFKKNSFYVEFSL